MRQPVRRFFFWCHLIAGCATGIVILLMSLTGVLLAFERQMLASAARSQQPPVQAGATPRPFEELIANALKGGMPEPASILMYRDPAQPLEFRSDPQSVLVDRYTGRNLGESAPRLHAFFQSVLALHRWLGMAGEHRGTGKAITGACNFAFFFLLLSGIYLWWPRKWTRRHLRPVTLYRSRVRGRARDVNWHTVTGFWCAIPLLVVVGTGIVMSYSWANALLYKMTGGEVPAGRERRESAVRKFATGPADPRANLEGLTTALASAERQVPNWQTILLQMPRDARRPFVLSVDSGNGGRPDLRSELVVDRAGNVRRDSTFAGYTLGRRLRSWVRFFHTGEAGGLVGQAIAALASFGGVLLAFTGLALAIRRFDFWRRRKRRAKGEEKTELGAVTLP
jgi:uncharacterized iron-regulated membrane protein